MKILFMEWRSLGQKDMNDEFKRRGWEVMSYPFPREEENTRLNPGLCEKLVRVMASDRYDFVFSFNYYPVVSIACNACRVKYLPMAAPVGRYDALNFSDAARNFYQTEISFIGSTYLEKKHRLYERLGKAREHTKGYLDGCIQVQKRVYGEFLLEEALIPEIMEDIMRHYPIERNPDGFERLEWVYAHYFLARQVTALERTEILGFLSQAHQVDLYTYNKTPELVRVRNRGTAEVMTEAPFIFRSSKINLNISLRCIL